MLSSTSVLQKRSYHGKMNFFSWYSEYNCSAGIEAVIASLTGWIYMTAVYSLEARFEIGFAIHLNNLWALVPAWWHLEQLPQHYGRVTLQGTLQKTVHLLFRGLHHSAADLVFCLALVHLKYGISAFLQHHITKIRKSNQIPEKPSATTFTKTNRILRHNVILGAKSINFTSFRKCTSGKNVCSFYATMRTKLCSEGHQGHSCPSEEKEQS